MDLINLVLKVIIWNFTALATYLQMCFATLPTTWCPLTHRGGELLVRRLLPHGHQLDCYFALVLSPQHALRQLSPCTCCIMVTGLPYAFWDLLCTLSKLLVHLHCSNASYTAGATLSCEMDYFTIFIDLYFISALCVTCTCKSFAALVTR